MNTPRSHIIFPPWNYKHLKMYKIRIRPPPGWIGMQRFPEAMSYICCHWIWTICDFEHAFYDIYCDRQGQGNIDTCQQAPWWASNNYVLGKWVDRTLYDNTGCSTDKHNWGPFLPQGIAGAEQCSLFFRYKLKFKLSGNAIWRPLPRQFQSEGLVPDPQGPNGPQRKRKSSDTKLSHKKKRRVEQACPKSTSDIWPGDLDSDGILTDRAYSRITADNTRDERHTLEDRKQRLKQRLDDLLRKYPLV